MNTQGSGKTVQDAGYRVTGSEAGGSAPSTQYFGPDGGIVRYNAQSETGPAQYALNFENSDIRDVVRAILTDALQINYTITGNLSGPVTIASSHPVSRETLLSSLESALDALGFGMSQQGEGYIIAPGGSGVGVLDRGSRTTPGYGVSVVPLYFVPAATMLELISGFVGESENLRISESKNTIVVRGSGPERAQVVQAIAAFDADFMADQYVAIYRLTQSRPEVLIPELERIFATTADDTLIQFRPVNRIRGIMAISKNGGLLRRAEQWVRRLDQQNSSAGENVFVYKARYRKATELARVISDLFVGSNGSSASFETDGGGFGGDTDPDAIPVVDGESTTGAVRSAADTRIASAFDEPAGGMGIGVAGSPNVLDFRQSGTGDSGVRISADASNNSVVVYSRSEEAAQILATLKRLDATPAQVAINVTIAEVRLTDELKYGVQYFVNSQRLGLGVDNGSVSLMDTAANVLQKQIPGLNVVLGSAANPDVVISALDAIGDVEVLSSPSVVVVENQTAALQVGDEVPITTRQSQSAESELAPIINQVEFKNTGIILNVTPRIGQNDQVTMEIMQEISNVTSSAETLTPTISKRRVESEISVANGQTVLLAGLISATRADDRKGIPGLNRIEIVRDLFGKREKTENRTELIVLIRPVVIRDAQDAGNVAAEIRANMRTMGSRRVPFK
ncbi:type II secretion system secretin GspD [Mesorhizobium sp. CAU 1741]|uniref:type II secretion system secretin GspD n=1 Tax=Mesorhizobium sp. CAU 1741 TaxID=3140366 RepID=UPI00325A6344